MKCVTYIYICDRSMWSKGLEGVFLSYMWCVLRAHMWETQPSKPSGTPAKLPGTCFLQPQASFYTSQQPPFLPSPSLVLEGYILLIIIPLSWIIPILRSGWRVPAGHDCWHRWSRPVMASICHCALASVRFLCCCSFCLSSLSLFFSWKCPFGTERRCYKGSTVIPVNMFQLRAGVQSQLDLYILLNGYWKLKYYEVKMSIFYCQKANRR